ncbi:MAG: substrate-binding domain-containing protein [Spirochaetes bacterium]|nr:substrate-binding domain-containing protein [Spirochaetota bacterium]MBU1081017.1 substrate-binding domain-containing protein [Spirochaetota bacterium]
MKKLTALAACAMVALTVAGAQAKVKIGVSIQGNKSTFMQYVVAGMRDYAKDLKDVELVIVYAEDRADKQVGQIENFIAQRVSAIIMNPVDSVASSAAVDAAVKAKIPIITVNTKTDNQRLATAFSGSDDVEAGQIQMEALARLVGYKGNVVLIHGAMGHSAQVSRRIGYTNVLKKYPGMKLAYEQSADWQTDKAQSLMEHWLQMGKPIAAVATNCDTMAVGAQNAVDAARLTGKVLVSGMDAIPDVMRSIKAGIISSTLWQDGIGQGAKAVELAVAAARGQKVADVYVPFELVTKDNIDAFIMRADARDALVKKYF